MNKLVSGILLLLPLVSVHGENDIEGIGGTGIRIDEEGIGGSGRTIDQSRPDIIERPDIIDLPERPEFERPDDLIEVGGDNELTGADDMAEPPETDSPATVE